MNGRAADDILTMVDDPGKAMEDLVAHVGRYPEQAFYFVREGLSYAADKVHGEETEAHRSLQQFLAMDEIDWDDMIQQYFSGHLPEPVMDAIEEAGGTEKLNRHIGGSQLCWGLRDYALRRWGMLARTVLESWNVRCTSDFGRIVFAFIDFNMMQSQTDDKLEDFQEIYSFDEAFDDPFRLDKPAGPAGPNS